MRAWNDRRGGMMVEAAVIVPIILILTFSVIWLTMDLFSGTVVEVRSDHAVFQEGFQESDHFRKAVLIGDWIHGEE